MNPFDSMANLPLFLLISVYIIELAVIALLFASYWKIFEKAGEAGWKAIIPFYGLIVALRITGRPSYWFYIFIVPILMIVPLVFIFKNPDGSVHPQFFIWYFAILILLIVYEIRFENGLSRCFGRSPFFTIGLVLLPIIFYPILAFGDDEYIRPVPKQKHLRKSIEVDQPVAEL